MLFSLKKIVISGIFLRYFYSPQESVIHNGFDVEMKITGVLLHLGKCASIKGVKI